MKLKAYIFACFMFAALTATAQEAGTVATDSVWTATIRPDAVIKGPEMSSVAICPDESVFEMLPAENIIMADTLRISSLDTFGQVPVGIYPVDWGGMYNWNLHEGLNVNLGASVFGAFGKHAPKGAGFAQNIAMMYALPLNNKLSLAVGGYFNNMTWDGRTFRSGGVNAVMGYRFDEHWEAYLYGQKSIMNRRVPRPLYDINGIGDRIGAAVKYNFNPSFSIQVSVEERRR